ncbi:unnamed protein product [Microthlaspi erraticum]|uniref:Retrotransposon gag domain-containing protein n=1 Tax=Microthlaspi erraticum TaxID=1685480 RepID=A0A6D2HYP3_9BRAS|nr:unnamed protein product [Microthlaspi erraticum]
MNTRSRRRNRNEDLLILSNTELARIERANKQQRPTSANMGDQGNDNMAAQLQQLQQEIEQMRKAQKDREPQLRAVIGDKDNPHTFYQNRFAIVPPAVQRQDFEIKPSIIALVKDHLFHGLPAEVPMDHIENFEEICSTTSSDGVPADFLKCKLFPFSLANKASRWLKSLPSGSLTTWAQCRAAFLNHFYTKDKTAGLRTKISSFQQYEGEVFCEAWERYREYRRVCPHNGYSDEQILSIFYDGVNWDYKNALNSASNGDFMTKSKECAFELIENLAASSSNKNAGYDRTVGTVSVKGSGAEAKKIEESTAKVNLLMKASQKSVHFVDETDDTPISQEFGGEEDEDDQMEVNYVSGQAFGQNRGFNQNYRNHPNMSYRSTNVENPQDQVYLPRSNQNQQGFQKSYPNSFQEKTFAPNQNRSQGGNQQKAQFSNQQQPSSSSNNSNDELKGMMQQMLMNQQKSSAETHLKIDTMYNDLNGKYEAVWTHVKKLDVQVAQTAEAVKRPHGTLPGKGETNPRNEYVAQVKLRSGRKLLPDAIPLKRPCKEKVDEHQETGGHVSGVDRAAPSGIDRSDDDASSSQEPILESDLPIPVAAEPAPARAYTPKVPYPVPPKKSRKDLEEAKCKEMLRDLTVKLPLSDAVQMIPALKKYIKELISGKVAEEENVMLVSEECSVVLQNKVIKKRSDPRRFVLSVQIGHMIFRCSLCDLGSSVNLMPYSVAKRLEYTKFKPTKVSLVFADRSTKFPVGILEDLHVQIGNTLIPADFVVLELDEEPKDPLILGRNFLCTAGAIIDVKGGTIDLHL